MSFIPNELRALLAQFQSSKAFDRSSPGSPVLSSAFGIYDILTFYLLFNLQ